MAYTIHMDFYETTDFTKAITTLLSDAEYVELQRTLVRNPKAGAVIPGAGGVRKIRWKTSRSGKRGGIRVIDYYVTSDDSVYMLFAYTKKDKADLTSQERKELAKLVQEELS